MILPFYSLKLTPITAFCSPLEPFTSSTLGNFRLWQESMVRTPLVNTSRLPGHAGFTDTLLTTWDISTRRDGPPRCCSPFGSRQFVHTLTEPGFKFQPLRRANDPTPFSLQSLLLASVPASRFSPCFSLQSLLLSSVPASFFIPCFSFHSLLLFSFPASLFIPCFSLHSLLTYSPPFAPRCPISVLPLTPLFDSSEF